MKTLRKLMFPCVFLIGVTSTAYANLEVFGQCRTPIQKKDNQIYISRGELLKRVKKYDTKGYFDFYLMSFDRTLPFKEKQKIYIRPYSPFAHLMLQPENFKDELAGVAYQFYDDNYYRPPIANPHTISDTEKQDIITLFNLMIDDDKKSHKIFNEMYQEYQQKIANKQMEYGCNVVAVDKYYDGKLFELRGKLNGKSDTGEPMNGVTWFSVR